MYATHRIIFLQVNDTGRFAEMVCEETAMSRRINSDLLLVGSLPAYSTAQALRAGGELFGDVVFRATRRRDGAAAVLGAYEHSHMLAPHPDAETVRPPGAAA